MKLCAIFIHKWGRWEDSTTYESFAVFRDGSKGDDVKILTQTRRCEHCGRVQSRDVRV